MVYEWRCTGCGHLIAINRPVADHDKGPTKDEAKHEECPGLTFKRVLSRPMRIQINENEDQYW